MDKKRHKCDFCEKENIPTEGFEGRCGHFIYACGKCIKEKTANRTKEDAGRIINNA